MTEAELQQLVAKAVAEALDPARDRAIWALKDAGYSIDDIRVFFDREFARCGIDHRDTRARGYSYENIRRVLKGRRP